MISRNAQISIGSVLAFMVALSIIGSIMRASDKKKKYTYM
jgi:hypothetical protein